MKKLLPVLVLICFGALCLCMHLFVFHTVRVEGTSMVDTLRSGDIVLVTRFDYRGSRQPERGDVVECSFPGRSGTYIKRVIGEAGDTIEIRNGEIYINGSDQPYEEPYLKEEWVLCNDGYIYSIGNGALTVSDAAQKKVLALWTVWVSPVRSPCAKAAPM